MGTFKVSTSSEHVTDTSPEEDGLKERGSSLLLTLVDTFDSKTTYHGHSELSTISEPF